MMKSDLQIKNVSEFGEDSGAGNLVGIQPFMQVDDYASAEAFAAKLNGYMAAVRARDWLGPKSIVVFPEYIGVWLAAVNEKPAVYAAESVAEAMRIMVFSHLIGFVRARLQARGRDKTRDSIFRMKSETMAHVYHDTFARLARSYGATIVAGSVVLPAPDLIGTELRPSKGPLQNVSVVYRPDGSAYAQLVRKAFLTSEELAFCAAGSPQDLPLFETPAGRLAVLICADSWYPASYAALAGQHPDIIVVPNNQMPQGSWLRIWQGYDPGPEPDDIDQQDIGTLVERDAWLKYALAGRMQAAGAKSGMHTFLRGRLWDLSSDGQAIVVRGEKIDIAPYVDGAALGNVWLA